MLLLGVLPLLGLTHKCISVTNITWSPPPSETRLYFFFEKKIHFFLRKFIFPLQKKKKEAPQAPRKNKMQRRRRRREKKYYFFLFWFLFSTFFFLENNLAKFWKFWDFLLFFFTMVSIGKVHFSAKCPFGRIGELKNFWKKIWMPDSKFSPFFMPKTAFFSIFGPPLFLGRRPKKNLPFH